MSFKHLAHRLARGVAPTVEAICRPLIAWLERAPQPRAGRWSSPGGQRVLVLAPHPDDEAMGCAGVILGHVAHADEVCVAIATDGRRSRAVSDPDAMAALRHTEAVQACAILGVHRLEWLGLPEGEWAFDALTERLARLLDEWQPDVVYAPSRVDFHPEHIAVARALASALSLPTLAPLPRRIRVYQVQVPLTAVLVNLVADVSGHWPSCERALRAYGSQAVSIARGFRQRRYGARAHGAGGAVEEFWELPTCDYVRLHREPRASGATPFRGLRFYPFTDPLAYLAGRGERRRLRASCGNTPGQR